MVDLGMLWRSKNLCFAPLLFFFGKRSYSMTLCSFQRLDLLMCVSPLCDPPRYPLRPPRPRLPRADRCGRGASAACCGERGLFLGIISVQVADSIDRWGYLEIKRNYRDVFVNHSCLIWWTSSYLQGVSSGALFVTCFARARLSASVLSNNCWQCGHFSRSGGALKFILKKFGLWFDDCTYGLKYPMVSNTTWYFKYTAWYVIPLGISDIQCGI